jgi:uncharacterized protein YdeI (YjbR/CyaY-like superfamily)
MQSEEVNHTMASAVPKPSLHFDSAKQWRRWLEANGAKATEVWLEIRKKRSERPGIFYEDAVNEALCFGWIDGKMKRVNKDMYVLRFSPRRKNSMWSRANRLRAERLIAAGKMENLGFVTIERACANGRWSSAYSSRERPDIPADLGRALSGCPLAQRNFAAMSNSHQLMYVSWILEAKKPQTRERRIAEVLGRARENRKPGQ